mgnify:FL=1
MAKENKTGIYEIIFFLMSIILIPNFLYFLWKNRTLSNSDLINEVLGNAVSGATQTLMIGWEYPAFGCCLLLPLMLLIGLGWKKLGEDDHSEDE